MAEAVGTTDKFDVVDEAHDLGCLEPIKLWAAHDQPERPLEPGVWLCRCATCLAAVWATAKRNPRCPLLIRTSFDRIVITAEYLVEIWQRDPWLDALLYQPGDFIRDMGAAIRDLPGPARWWSRCLAEQVGVREAYRVRVAEHRPLPRVHMVVASPLRQF